MIKLENVTKVYKGDNVALRDATLGIDKGEFVFLVGASGSGKSTFIRLLNREEVPEHGTIYVAGKDIGTLGRWKVPYLRRNIGYIFQDFKLLPNKTVAENVAFALEVIGKPRQVIRKQVPAILDLVGLGQLLGHPEGVQGAGGRRERPPEEAPRQVSLSETAGPHGPLGVLREHTKQEPEPGGGEKGPRGPVELALGRRPGAVPRSNRRGVEDLAGHEGGEGLST